MERNPVEHATLPRCNTMAREIWTADILFKALKLYDDETLALAINLAFSCSLRMKAVQSDSGHSRVQMVADVYSHILDDDRQVNAQRFEEEFYREEMSVSKEVMNGSNHEMSQEDKKTFLEISKNPELLELLKRLVQKI